MEVKGEDEILIAPSTHSINEEERKETSSERAAHPKVRIINQTVRVLSREKTKEQKK